MAPEPFLDGIAYMACAELYMLACPHPKIDVANLAAAVSNNSEVIKGCQSATTVGGHIFNEPERHLFVNKVSHNLGQTFWGYRHG